MTVTLSIKNAPEAVVRQLKRRAERNHRSLQGELLAIIEAAAIEETTFTPMEVLQAIRRLGINTPAEAPALVRADRDGR